MSKHQLTQDQIQQVAQCLSDGVEIPDHLLKLLSPSYFDKLSQEYNIDYQKLERYKIPTIEYAGKRSEALILSQAGTMGGGSPLQVERCFQNNAQQSGSPAPDDWRNLIVQGDNLQFLKTCYLNQDPLIKDKVKGKVKLIYIDPPFATKSEFGGKEGESSYADKVDRAEFLEAIRERLIFLRELLSDDGSFFVHLDEKMSDYIKIILDELFGKGNYRNSIVWKRVSAHNDPQRFGVVNDTIFYYSKTNNFIWNQQLIAYEQWYIDRYYRYKEKNGRRFLSRDLTAPGGRGPKYIWKGIERNWRVTIANMEAYESENRIFYTENGIPRYKQYLDEIEGTPVQNLWDDIQPLVTWSAEEILYPTQKPEALLERIIRTATNPGDLVLDCFAGSGTTAAVAEKLGRRWIACDFGKHSIYTMQKRLLEIADSKQLGKEVKTGEKYGQPAQPFCVASVGAYDFQRIMSLREHKPSYIDFVLSLFGITDRAKIEGGEYTDELARKFRMTNIFGQKDGNPVEVYPIWEDDFLKHIKIDRDYLEGIINQGGGRMKGKYFIIAPETCDVIGDTTIGETEFIILSYPYKILEEMSRNFQLTEQPSSEENINDLVSSVRFYFNEEIEIGIERAESGLKVTRLVSPILDKDDKHFEGFGALAMLLVDKDYDGTTFRMEEAIYAKHLDEHGVCTIAGLSDKVAIIAIDKHGNESKPMIL